MAAAESIEEGSQASAERRDPAHRQEMDQPEQQDHEPGAGVAKEAHCGN